MGRSVSIGILAGILLGCTQGCGEDNGRVRVYQVSGKVIVEGQPAEGAEVVFYGTTPEFKGNDMPIPSGTTDSEGEFRLRSFEPNDGAPAGEFKVTVYWPEPIPPDVDQEMYEPKDRLGGRYMNPRTTDLSATVEKGGGKLPPFELK